MLFCYINRNKQFFHSGYKSISQNMTGCFLVLKNYVYIHNRIKKNLDMCHIVVGYMLYLFSYAENLVIHFALKNMNT